MLESQVYRNLKLTIFPLPRPLWSLLENRLGVSGAEAIVL